MAYETPSQNEALVEQQDSGRNLDTATGEFGKRRRGRPRGQRFQTTSRSDGGEGRRGADTRPSEEALPVVKFRAILSSRGDPIKVGQDGDSRVQMEAAATHLAQVLKLVLFRGRVFDVTVSVTD